MDEAAPKKRGGRTSGTRPKGSGPGIGGPANPGWGGPAKGAWEQAAPIPQFAPGNNARSRPSQATRTRAARTAELENMLFDLAVEAENEMTRVQAGTKLHAIYNGQPVARNVNATVDDVSQLSDDAIRAELEGRGGAPGAAAAGDAAAGVSPVTH